jgi:phosphohistidine phosphatase
LKTLILLRHGKALKESTSGNDYDRTLDERGKTEVAHMARLLKEKKTIPEIIVASPAKRTSKTAEIVIKELGLNKSHLEFESSIYDASLQDLMHVIRAVNNNYSQIMLVGHNPSITGLVGFLTPTFLEHVPTSGLVAIELEISIWQMAQPQCGKLLWYKGPKD